jgi:hypothetical protein
MAIALTECPRAPTSSTTWSAPRPSVVLAACAGGIAVRVQPHVLSGILIVRNNDGGDVEPARDEQIGAYGQAVPAGGPAFYSPPTPAATARTDENGVFRFTDLPAGRWFVQPISAPGSPRVDGFATTRTAARR